MESQTPLTNKEKYKLKQQEKLHKHELVAKKQRIKNIVLWVVLTMVGLLLIGGIIWFIVSQPKTPKSDVISRNGFHWHPELTIYVNGEKQEISANIGIGSVHQSIHTHDDSDQGVIH